MTNNKTILTAKIAGISFLGFMMMFAVAAPSLNQAHASGFDICQRLGADYFTWDAEVVIDFFDTGDTIIVWKCWNPDPDCFNDAVPVEAVPQKSLNSTNCQNTTGAIMISDDPNAVLTDSIPAEWDLGSLTTVAGNCTSEVKGNSGKGATVIECTTQPSDVGNVAAFTVDSIDTRESPSNNKNPNNPKPDKYKPTSCGLDVNGGAAGFVPDRTFNDDGDDGTTPEVPFETSQTDAVPIDVEGCLVI